ncbi:MAG: hypothetical protein LC121_25980 [Anaerolineae bacterium]|nr:hypothetical protein [Anaerolineae bacterium]
MNEIAERLGTTSERAAILRGFIALRAKLQSLGIIDGYQWCAGSFCEDIENSEGRSPRDLDVVTFFTRPQRVRESAAWMAFVAANSVTFDAAQTKATFRCDAYFVDATNSLPSIIDQVTYWHGLFGHRRISHMWKGMLRLPIVSDDADALAHLDRVWP